MIHGKLVFVRYQHDKCKNREDGNSSQILLVGCEAEILPDVGGWFVRSRHVEMVLFSLEKADSATQVNICFESNEGTANT